jgi:hypothetical protein
MKAAALTMRTATGDVVAIGSEKLGPLLDQARAIARAGKASIGGQEVGIAEGVVMASWRPFPQYKFRVSAQSVAPVIPVMAGSRKARIK